MSARLLIFAVAFVATIPLVSRAGDDCVRSYLDLRRLIGTEEYERAFERSVELVERFPDFPPLYEAVAELGLYTRRWDRSEAFFADRIRQGIEVPLALFGYANSLASRDDHANAIQYCMESIERGLTYSGVYKELAYAYEKAYGDEEALSMLGRLSRRFPRSAGYHYAVAVEMWNRGDFRPVVSRLKEAVALDPGQSRYGDALAVADLHLAYSRRKAERVEARRSLALLRGDIAGSQFLISSLLSDQIYAGDHRRRDTVLQESTAEASEYGFLRWLGWNLQRSADIDGLASRLDRARQQSIKARELASRSNDINLALVATQRISSAFLEAGVLDSALIYARLRWSLSSRAKSPNDYVSGIGKIALILFYMGHLKLANEYCIEALAEADSKIVDAVTRAEIETTFGMIQERLGNMQVAFRHHMLARKVHGNGIPLPYCLAANSGNLGRIRLSEGRFNEALQYFMEELSIAKQLCYPYERAYALINLGDLAFEQRRLAKSEAFYIGALDIAKGIGSGSLEFEALDRLARVTWRRGEVERSLEYYTELEKAGMVCILNGRAEFPELSLALRDKAHLELTTGRWQTGLATLAAAKGVDLYPYTGGAFFTATVNSELVSPQTFHEADSRLTSAMAGLQKEIENRTPSLSSRSAELLAMTEVVDARLAISQLARARIAKGPPSSGLTRLGWGLAELQSYLRSQSSCIVQYLLRDEGVTALCINGDTVVYRRVEMSKAELEKLIRLLSPVLKEEGIDVPLLHSSMAAFDLRVSRRLYKAVLEPFRCFTDQAKRLIILPDGLLANVPFEALVTDIGVVCPSPRFLIQRNEISYCQFLNQLRPHEGPRSAAITLLAVADPAFKGDGMLQKVGMKFQGSPVLGQLEFGSLPGTRKEANVIRNLFGSRCRLIVGLNAAKEEIVRTLPQFNLVHLATHSVSPCTDANFNGLAFSPMSGDRSDGILRLYELRALELNAELVVLNGCRTARGKGENLTWSPALAFAVAGARAVIGTLWDVGDETSSELICNFYSAIDTGLSASAGLRKAKLAEIAKGNGNPLLWASHVLIGDPNAFEGFAQTIESSPASETWLVKILLCYCICSIFSLAGLIVLSATSVGAVEKCTTSRVNSPISESRELDIDRC